MSTIDRASPFLVSLAAKVISTWRDKRHGCRYEDIDYLTMSLKIPTWPVGDTLLARIKNPKGEPQFMIEGKMYDIRGRVYFKKQWHRQYLIITEQSEFPEVSDAQAQGVRHPLFEVVCNITGVFGSNKIGLIWGVLDEYEDGRGEINDSKCRQYVSTTCPFAKEAVAKDVHKLWKIGGRMLGPTDLRILEMHSISPE